jgi:TDG/mug DNA glycosylase family protein
MAVLPDYVRPGLDLVFVGINPGLRSAETGHHYAGRGNHFWPLLHESGLVSEPLTYAEDARVLEWNIGLTNMVDRASATASGLSAAELRAGATALRRKLAKYAPRIVCFNGKVIGEAYLGRRCSFGVQESAPGDMIVYMMPSTSARTASHQRADKLRHFEELRRLVERGAEVAV